MWTNPEARRSIEKNEWNGCAGASTLAKIERESAADEGRSWLARELQFGRFSGSGPLLEPAIIYYGIPGLRPMMQLLRNGTFFFFFIRF